MSFIPNGVQVVSFLLVRSGQYNQQYRRSLSTLESEQSAVDTLRDRIGGHGQVKPGTLSGIANQILRINAVPEGELDLDKHGWGQRRYMFILTVDIKVRGSVRPIRQIMMGYTQTTEKSLYGTLDPDEVFTINNIVTLRERTVEDRFGRKHTTKVPQDCSYLLANERFAGFHNSDEQRIDPFDMMGVMMTTNENFFDDEGKTFNYTGAHNSTPTKIKRGYAQPSQYLSTILSSFGSAVIQAGPEKFHQDYPTLCAKAQENVSGDSASNDGFLLAIRNVSGSGWLTRTFTLRNLEALHPRHPMEVFDVDDRLPTRRRYVRDEDVLGEHVHEIDDTDPDGWKESSTETQFAAIVAHTLPNLMLELFFTSIYFTADNKNHDGRIRIDILSQQTIEEFDFRTFLDTLEQRIAVEILRDISLDGKIDFEMRCRCEVFSETWVEISIAGGDWRRLAVPTFADASMTPMITNIDNASGIAKDMAALVNDVILGENSFNDRHSSKTGDPVWDIPDTGAKPIYTGNDDSPFKISI